MLNLITPPESLCILRLSAIGDTCHVVPVVRTLQRVWPATRLTWIIGRLEARLMTLLPGVEFITIDKRAGLAAARAVRRALRGRRFDVLLHMQLSLRASLVSLRCARRCVWGSIARARASCNGCSPTRSIAPRVNEHVLDSFQGFLGGARDCEPVRCEWNLPLPPEARAVRGGADPGCAADADHQSVLEPCGAQLARRALRGDRRPRGRSATACA